tara:strand:+ start:206 stop:511 length:306 start_codon:yes stop_codon:yes gene_type:complete
MTDDEGDDQETAEMVIELSDEQIDAVKEGNTEGEGGFQSLISSLQGNLDEDEGTLTLDEEQQERVPRYAKDYGQGGWEDQLTEMVGEELMEELDSNRKDED